MSVEEQKSTPAWCGVGFLWSACNSSFLPNLHPHAFPQLEQGPFPQATVFKFPPTHGVLMVSSWLRCGCFLYCGLLHKLWGLLAPEFEVSSCLVLQPYWLCAAGSPCMCCLLSFFNTVRQRLSCPLWWGHCGTIWNHPNRLCQAHGSPGLQSQRLHLCFLLPVSPWRPITRCLTELVPALHQSQAALRYLVWGITTAKMPVLSVAVQQELTDVCD